MTVRQVWILLLFVTFCTTVTSDSFSEELYIRDLPTGHVYSFFQFLTTWESSNSSDEHYHLLPKSLGEVLYQYDVQELHLTFTQSVWRHNQWGQPLEDAPTGAQLWIWFKEASKGTDEKWRDLINVLSGMFCASLKFMDSTVTVVPKMSFRPWGVISQVYHRFGKGYLRYAALPGEMVCTENLTPWKKLLPCGARFGLGSLLHSLKLYDSSFQSLGLHIRPVCKDAACTAVHQELKQTLSVVSDVTTNNYNKVQNWSLRSLFGQVLTSKCPLADTSAVYVDASNEQIVELTPPPQSRLETHLPISASQWLTYDLTEVFKHSATFELSAKYSQEFHLASIPPPPLHATQTQTGFGEKDGGLMTMIYNMNSVPVTIVYMETIPWFLRVFLQTLKVESFSIESPVVGKSGKTLKPDHMHYSPGRSRERAYLLELLLTLPAQSVTRIHLDYEKSLLKWTEYPPDAHHGFYIPAAVLTAEIPAGKSHNGLLQNTSLLYQRAGATAESTFVRLHTESVLVTLPTPDFSMPYNVICLTCTVLAIAFGSIHNITTRGLAFKDPNKKSFIGRLIQKIKSKLGRKKPSDSDSLAEEIKEEQAKMEEKEEMSESSGIQPSNRKR